MTEIGVAAAAGHSAPANPGDTTKWVGVTDVDFYANGPWEEVPLYSGLACRVLSEGISYKLDNNDVRDSHDDAMRRFWFGTQGNFEPRAQRRPDTAADSLLANHVPAHAAYPQLVKRPVTNTTFKYDYTTYTGNPAWVQGAGARCMNAADLARILCAFDPACTPPPGRPTLLTQAQIDLFRGPLRRAPRVMTSGSSRGAHPRGGARSSGARGGTIQAVNSVVPTWPACSGGFTA
jgi:hypothetical protein